MPHFFRVANNMANHPLYDLIDDDPDLNTLLSRTFGSCLTGPINLAGANQITTAPFHCTAPPADITTLIFRTP